MTGAKYYPTSIEIFTRTSYFLSVGIVIGGIGFLLTEKIGWFLAVPILVMPGLLLYTRRVFVKDSKLFIDQYTDPIPVELCTRVYRTKNTFKELIRRMTGKSTAYYLVEFNDGGVQTVPLCSIGMIAVSVAKGLSIPFEIIDLDS